MRSAGGTDRQDRRLVDPHLRRASRLSGQAYPACRSSPRPRGLLPEPDGERRGAGLTWPGPRPNLHRPEGATMLKPIVIATLIAGTLDILSAFVFAHLAGMS